MDSPFENPSLRYGLGLSSAAILVVVAFTFLEGTIRWIVLGLAVLEVVVTPRILKMAAEQADE
ncbi:hypothetical protein [Halorussus amylolyticus]|uniref:hypothetical protein n=1 Tax=Halorussus amylolyticus TaxID=1126242 RepID=UPI00104A0899|nr:hypothetical protein [Halorussus amylolyticus]